jgi:drug/metabolite transporter (DMT)-like permease
MRVLRWADGTRQSPVTFRETLPDEVGRMRGGAEGAHARAPSTPLPPRPVDIRTPHEERGERRGRPENVPLGIACMIGATLMFAISAAIMKIEVARYPIGEVMAGRSLCSLAISTAAVLPVTGFGVFATRKPGAHLARGLSQATSQTFTVIALWFMPLAGAIAVGFSAPLFAAILSTLWLKERADGARIAALAAGFLGVLVVTRPAADSMQIGALFALMNAAMYGSVTVAVRGMTKTESTLTLLMWQMTVVAICHAALLVFGCRLPAASDAGLLLASGLANALAQALWTKSLRFGPTAAVSPFYYFMLVWAMLIGFLVWGDRPAASLIIGSTIVVGAGLALLARETRATR